MLKYFLNKHTIGKESSKLLLMCKYTLMVSTSEKLNTVLNIKLEK